MSNEVSQDEMWMDMALSLARTAAFQGEVPVGAIVVHEGRIIGSGFNLRESTRQASAHAEFLAMQKASEYLDAWRLLNCTLYVTLEPCLMCAGLIWQARVPRVVYGARDPKGGALGSLYSLHDDARLNHRYPVIEGVRQGECAAVLQSFFRARRTAKNV